MLRLLLFIAMVVIGVLYTWLTHSLMEPLYNNLLAHCIILGFSFGLINFLLANLFFYKHKKLSCQNEMLKSKLNIDKLTGLFNRSGLDQDLNNFNETSYSVIFIDIDNFRVFNNQYSHEAGDAVLRKVSEIVKTTIRVGDNAYRYGGEEIVVILKNCTIENARKIAEKIRTRINMLSNEPYPQITVSLGVASCSENEQPQPIQDIIEKADFALLRAKASGKNRTILFKSGMARD
ncbi:GGDEF domain-containing protein [Desulfitobacterium sp. THU1]|uniref:GGDEF domain-containing protein n=1 Tax=Desulfitobacterium sp. THU1 TaxID=3138072 RepID=UPI0031200523